MLTSIFHKYAMQIAKKNYPDIIHVGDVQDVMYPETFDGHKIDLIIGGSPCQGFSFAGQRLNFDDPRSKLFFEYARLVKECKPKYFLLENVRMKQESQDVITEILGVEPIAINSNLVSAQNRYRLYWTNIPLDGQPDDEGILLKDILEDYHQIGAEHFHSDKAVAYMERGNDKWMQAGNRRADRYTQTPDKEKAFTLTANIYKGVPYNYFEDTRATLEPSDNGLILAGHANLNGHDCIKRVYHPDGKAPTMNACTGGNREPKVFQPPTHYRKLTPLECERLQTVPDNYTEGVSNTQRYKMLGNGWTADVIAHIFRGMLSTQSINTHHIRLAG
jgi:DNA-cytosine methyltransferase